MPRRLIKTGIASALYWTGTDGLLARRASVKSIPLVVGYHRVVEDFGVSAASSIAPMLVSVRTFERHLDWIGRRYEFVTLNDLAAWTEGAKRFDRPVAAITFDDGYADVYHHAFPILKRKGIPAGVFVVTDLVGISGLQTNDELYLLLSDAFSRWRDPRRRLVRLLRGLHIPVPVLKKIDVAAADSLRATGLLIKNLPRAEMGRVIEAFRAEAEIHESAMEKLRSMSWEMLREMSRSGVTVGSHTRTHAFLTLETRKKVIDETQGSRVELERRLGTPIKHFAYPCGAFNARVVSAVAAAGYHCAYTSCRHRDARYPALTIPRRLWWENSGLDAFGRFSPALMSCSVSGVFDFTASCRQAHAS
jgi:peptidoglycan/xylan/chitin deacetylase (PgdA/CDA1 family)